MYNNHRHSLYCNMCPVPCVNYVCEKCEKFQNYSGFFGGGGAPLLWNLLETKGLDIVTEHPQQKKNKCISRNPKETQCIFTRPCVARVVLQSVFLGIIHFMIFHKFHSSSGTQKWFNLSMCPLHKIKTYLLRTSKI